MTTGTTQGGTCTDYEDCPPAAGFNTTFPIKKGTAVTYTFKMAAHQKFMDIVVRAGENMTKWVLISVDWVPHPMDLFRESNFQFQRPCYTFLICILRTLIRT